MDIDQLEKTVQWLDEERRNDKRLITELQKKIKRLEGKIDKSTDSIKEWGGEVARLGVYGEKMKDFDDTLDKLRAEVKKELGNQESRLKRREQYAKKKRSEDIDDLSDSVAKMKTEVNAIKKIRMELGDRVENEAQFTGLLKELENQLSELDEKLAEKEQDIHSLQDDMRRVVDLQGETAAMRKRTDELRAKIDMMNENQRKTDSRISEIMTKDNTRVEEHNAFLDKLKTEQIERQRSWDEWAKDYKEFDLRSAQLQEHLINIAETNLAVKRAQESFDEINERMNRRIAEITEMQRLGEERFRQEWSTFKADDQKRWTNYTLTQNEYHRELNRRLEKMVNQMTTLEDNLQDMRDIVQFISGQSEKQMQTLLNSLREWVSENERFLSSAR